MTMTTSAPTLLARASPWSTPLRATSDPSVAIRMCLYMIASCDRTSKPSSGDLLALQFRQQPLDELRRIAQQRSLVRQLLLKLPQRLDERAAFGQRLLHQLAGLLLAHRL